MPAAAPAAPTAELTPGLVVLHGNRLELLADAVFEWLARAPLAPLEEEVFLVQSNATAEWLKAALAQRQGVCAAVRTELPARFVWRAYRAQLGAAGAPAQSPLDKAALRWRLMAQLPALQGQAGFEVLGRYLRSEGADDDGAARRSTHEDGAAARRRWQLAGALADVLDQYQVYRADWLQAWARGEAVLVDAQGRPSALAADQAWQAHLWQALLQGLSEDERAAARPAVHARFIESIEAGTPPARALPRRVVVFGLTHLPLQTLQALMALSQRCQVLVAAPNPCRWHWADIIDGREWFAGVQRRLPPRREGAEAVLPLHAAHLDAHPLLAAWGRQGRDFMRLLDAHDARLPRIDLFETPASGTLLARVQAAICELLPLAEHPRALGQPGVAAHDRSIVFHLAHSAQREVEVLHEQLLHLFADPPGGVPLAPRQVVVMVPDLAPFEAAIHAVFGQYAASDARHIPYAIADLGPRGREPLLVALEWLLQAPQPRCTASELRDLLEVPSLARRFGLDEADLPTLVRWIAGSGVRWGLDAGHRDTLGLGAAGDVNTWAFGVRRMLLGYASGDTQDADFAGIAPYDEVGGLDAAAAGALAELLQALADWWQAARQPRTPTAWAAELRQLLARLFLAREEPERLALAGLDDALVRWLEACAAGGFDAPVPLTVVREAWLDTLAEPSLSQRFAGGGVTFCTLLPMRAIPFEVVCLLGMNEGDYPRRPARQDFDLMNQAGQRRAGDRAARDDDRYLLLEALLAARRVLYVSWCGRSVRDNTPQPPSPLIGELRDYLDAGFGDPAAGAPALTERLTTAHPLQPFSRRYFAPGAAAQGLVSYAREWRAAHQDATPVPASAAPAAWDITPLLPLKLARLAEFLKNPVRHHYRWRLDVYFTELAAGLADEESFGLDRLEETGLLQRLLDDAAVDTADASGGVAALRGAARALQREGLLPLGMSGQAECERLVTLAAPMQAAMVAWHVAHPAPAEPLLLRLEVADIPIDDGLDGLRRGSDGGPRLLSHRASRLRAGNGRPGKAARDGKPQAPTAGHAATLRVDKLIDTWLPALASAAAGQPLAGTVVGMDVVLHWRAPDADTAWAALQALCHGWAAGLQQPLPVAARSALAYVAEGDITAAETTYDGQANTRGEREEASLARTWPDFDALQAGGEFESWAYALYAPVFAWANEHVQVEALPGAILSDIAAEGDDGGAPADD